MRIYDLKLKKYLGGGKSFTEKEIEGLASLTLYTGSGGTRRVLNPKRVYTSSQIEKVKFNAERYALVKGEKPANKPGRPPKAPKV
jgi:hypothetical protein